MNAEELIRELGRNLGVRMEFGHNGTCRAAFDGDVVDFEKADEYVMVMADIGPAADREDAFHALLASNKLGVQTGGATIGLDESRSKFTLYVELWGAMPYPAFEARLVLFIQALRRWKEWLARPAEREAARALEAMSLMGMAGMLRV